MAVIKQTSLFSVTEHLYLAYYYFFYHFFLILSYSGNPDLHPLLTH